MMWNTILKIGEENVERKIMDKFFVYVGALIGVAVGWHTSPSDNQTFYIIAGAVIGALVAKMITFIAD